MKANGIHNTEYNALQGGVLMANAAYLEQEAFCELISLKRRELRALERLARASRPAPKSSSQLSDLKNYLAQTEAWVSAKKISNETGIPESGVRALLYTNEGFARRADSPRRVYWRLATHETTV